MSGGKKQTVGYKYNVGMHIALCHGPIDRIVQIKVDGKEVWAGNLGQGSVTINKPDIFGGESREGGIQGTVDFMLGGPGQLPNSYLAEKIGGLMPAFRGIASVVLRHVYVGLNPYLKKWSFRASRIHVRQNGIGQWYDRKAEIKGVPRLKKTQRLFFALDRSTSMDASVGNGRSRFQVMKENVVSALDEINELRKASAVRVDLCICFWTNQNVYRTYENASDADFEAAKAFVNGMGTHSGGTYFNYPFELANVYFGSTVNGGSREDRMFFVTDGEPTGSSLEAALATGADMIQRTGQFGGDNQVDIYAANIDQSNIDATGQVDNTPWDGVPIIDGSSNDGLSSMIYFAMAGDVSSLNGAHIIRECLTDPEWGMGYTDGDIDDTSFRVAADRLFIEGMGLSLLWDGESEIESFVKEVIKHIDAALYVSRETGKYVLKLIRNDYNRDDLLVLDASNVDKITDYSRSTIDELVNTVTVKYWDARTGTTGSVSVSDLALAQVQGTTINRTIEYEGFTNSTIATIAAERDLRTLATPLVKCTVYANTDAEHLNVGDVFVLNWPDLNIYNMVMRVNGIAYGTGRQNRVRIQCTQDIFSTPTEALLSPPDYEWDNPSQPPGPITRRAVFELPYYELVQIQGQTAIDELLAANPQAGYVGAGAGTPVGAAINARLYTNPGSGFEDSGAVDFCPVATLNEDVGKMQTVFAVTGFDGLDQVTPGTWCQIDNELMGVVSVTASQIEVQRGVLDTVPQEHLTGAAIVFWDETSSADPTEYVQGDVVEVKLSSVSGSGELPLADAPTDVVNVVGRAFRPYVPGNFQIDGEYYPTQDKTGTIAITWSSRNRVQQTGGSLVEFGDPDIAPEPGTTYTIRLYATATMELLAEHTGITETSFNVSLSNLNATQVTIRLWAVRDGLESFQFQEHVISVLQPALEMTFAAEDYTPPNGDAVNFTF